MGATSGCCAIRRCSIPSAIRNGKRVIFPYEILIRQRVLSSRTFMPAAIATARFQCGNRRKPRRSPMLDIVMLALGLGFFALSIGYAHLCDRL
jgi:hypothetical protein